MLEKTDNSLIKCIFHVTIYNITSIKYERTADRKVLCAGKGRKDNGKVYYQLLFYSGFDKGTL